MNGEPQIIALIPAYDEETSIAGVIREAKLYVTRVIVCDDGSKDRTHEIAKASGATVVRHRRNLGYGAALSTLFDEARKLDPDVVVTLDADGQHDAAYIPGLVQPILADGIDIVIGSRFVSADDGDKLPPYRKVGIRLITKLSNKISYSGITDAQSGFRAYGREALRTIRLTEKGMGASTEILIRAKQANLSVKEVAVRMNYQRKTSKENPLLHWLEVVTSTIKHASKRYPGIFYGIPGLVMLTVALGFWKPVILGGYDPQQPEVTVLLLATVATLMSAVLLSAGVVLRKLPSNKGEK